MKRTVASAALLWVLATGLGCQHDEYARQLIQPNTHPGKVRENLTGSGDQLVARNRISEHRVITVGDGTDIDVWTISAREQDDSAEQPRGTVVVLHGTSESKATYLGVGRRLSTKGFDVVLPDLRRHGRSGGEVTTYGAKEKQDVKTVMDELLAEQVVSEPVYAVGTTLGAATAILYAAIDDRVEGVMVITPYKDAETMMRRHLAIMAPAMSAADVREVIDRAAEMGDFELSEASAQEAAPRLDCPLLLIHGLIDVSVPLEHSETIYRAANEPKDMRVFKPGPEHMVLIARWEDWIAERVDELVETGLAD
ncbi:MAG: alpha/beta hydrolase [Phycisphaerae bacterium]